MQQQAPLPDQILTEEPCFIQEIAVITTNSLLRVDLA
jgi:hypothetical protein